MLQVFSNKRCENVLVKSRALLENVTTKIRKINITRNEHAKRTMQMVRIDKTYVKVTAHIPNFYGIFLRYLIL